MGRWLAVLLMLATGEGLAADDWRFQVSPGDLRADVEAAVRPWQAAVARPGEQTSPVRPDADVAIEAVAAVRETLKALGYYEAQTSLVREQDGWRLRVEAGEPVRVRSLKLEWLGDMEDDRRFKAPEFPLAIGDVLHQGRYGEFKQQVADHALEQGYFDGRWVSHDIAIDLRQRRADITLRYDSGSRHRFGEVRFVDFRDAPLSGLDERWLRSLVPFKSGDFISSRKLFQLQKVLLESRYFADVRVSLRHDQANGLVIPVEVRADNRKPNKMSVGLGYATDVGPRLTLEWQRHLLNERGHGLEATTELSQVRQRGELRYRIPWSHPTQDFLQFVLGAQRDVIAEETTTRQTAIAVQRVIQPPRDWQVTYGVRVSDERFERPGEKDGQMLVVPGISFNKLRSRGGLDPTEGLRQFYQVEISHPGWLSQAEYMLLRGGLRWLDTWAERHMLLARVDGGAILSPGFDRVPPSVRFYAGGDNSVRGYDYRNLAPRASSGDVVGGQYLVAGSLEYNWRWRPTWRPALFMDAGNAFNTRWQPLAVGAGVGLRWISPVGPVRLDIASALSEPGRPLRLHVTLGASL